MEFINFVDVNTELLKPKHFAVGVVFYEACNCGNGIVTFYENLAKHIGWGGNSGDCDFWEDLDEYDRTKTEKFDGVRFTFLNEESVIISFEELYYYMKTALAKYTPKNEEEKKRLDNAMKTYREKHGIKE
ncbi:MAG: hypothetical protein IJS65_04375 [Clostridia bacterium]|nr:hypothetical protein [Clostridia bacterium]